MVENFLLVLNLESIEASEISIYIFRREALNTINLDWLRYCNQHDVQICKILHMVTIYKVIKLYCVGRRVSYKLNSN